MVEFALVAPLFFMVIFGIIVLGLGVFYQQQLSHAAREAARYAILHTSGSQCPTISNRLPDVAAAGVVNPCDTPASRWPEMTGYARGSVSGMDRGAVHFSACWSGYWTVDTSGSWADYDEAPRDATGAANPFRTCTIGGIDPRQSADTISCPAPLTTIADDMASNYSEHNAVTANEVSVYACYVWQPPLAGFLLIPSQVILRAVVTEALEYQQ